MGTEGSGDGKFMGSKIKFCIESGNEDIELFCLLDGLVFAMAGL